MTMATLKRVKQESQTGMRKVLHDLAIDPFDMQTVKEYKEKALKPYKWRSILFSWYIPIDNCLKIGTLTSAAILLVAALIIPIVAAHSTLITANDSLNYLWWMAFTPICLFISVGVFDKAMQKLKTASWKFEWLMKYKQPIPEFVQQTVDDIKASGQQCDIFIDYMAIENVILPDPFLVLRCVENCQIVDYYVEVWNEKYQKKRVV